MFGDTFEDHIRENVAAAAHASPRRKSITERFGSISYQD
jgi:hypothetical protein